VTDWSGWLARGGAQIDTTSGALLTYAFTSGQTMVVRRPQQTDGQALPVLVSSEIAKAAPAGGAITLNFQDTQLPARIVGVAKRFPGVNDQGQGFVVVDESRLATALSADVPGTAVPDELWLSVPEAAPAARVATELTRSPFASLQVASRHDLQHQLDSQPLARGITLTLGAAGLIAVLLAAVGFLLTLVSDARDERGELFDLEAQGASPATIRSHLRLRALLVACFGLVGGLATGAVLSALTLSLVSVTASAATPEPPLRLVLDWQLLGLALLAYAFVAAVLVLAATHLPGRALSRGAEVAA
jgi:hypothetical protein